MVQELYESIWYDISRKYKILLDVYVTRWSRHYRDQTSIRPLIVFLVDKDWLLFNWLELWKEIPGYGVTRTINQLEV